MGSERRRIGSAQPEGPTAAALDLDGRVDAPLELRKPLFECLPCRRCILSHRVLALPGAFAPGFLVPFAADFGLEVGDDLDPFRGSIRSRGDLLRQAILVPRVFAQAFGAIEVLDSFEKPAPANRSRAGTRDSSSYWDFRNVPFCSSRKACWSCSCVFITIGPYQATGSSSGFPETSRNRMPSSPACTSTSSPASKRTSERLSASFGGVVSAQPTPSVGTARGLEALQNLPLPAKT